MALITIDSSPLPNPTSYKVTLADLDSGNTRRTENGLLKRSRVRSNIYSIEVGWEGVTKAQLQSITDALSPEKFQVTFFDPTQSANTTISAYASDRSGELSSVIDEAKPEETYWNVSVSLVEY
jgi:hypothetical protein